MSTSNSLKEYSSWFLGIRPPKVSERLSSATSVPAAVSGAIGQEFLQGRIVPITDNFRNRALEFAWRDGGAANEYSNIGSVNPTTGTVHYVARGGLAFSGRHIQAIAYNPEVGREGTVHFWHSSQSTTQQLSTLDVATGAITNLGPPVSFSLTAPSDNKYKYIADVDPATRETTRYWVASNNRLARTRHDTAGAKIGSFDAYAKLDGVYLNTSWLPHYVSKNEDRLVTEWCQLEGIDSLNKNYGRRALIGMVVHRGGVSRAIVIPYDGTIPMPERFADSTDGTLAGSNTLQKQQQASIIPWGEEVIFYADDTYINSGLTGDGDYISVHGNRFLDRVDFDRWLNDVADYYNMPLARKLFEEGI